MMHGGRPRAIAATVVAALAVALAAAPTRPAAAQGGPEPQTVSFAVIGDYGSNDPGEAAVATLVDAADPAFIATVGDNAYAPHALDTAVGQYFGNYICDYQGSHGTGSVVNRFFPALGNHDHTDGGGLPAYLAYFTLPGAGIVQAHPSGNERYYDVVQGPVHLFLLDSSVLEPDGNTQTSPQAMWLQQGLAASDSRWDVVLFHHSPYTSWSLPPGNKEALQWPFEAWGADLVVSGHVHTYERVVRDDDHDGAPLTYVVNGLGGEGVHQFDAVPVGGSQVRYNAQFGALFLDASATELSAGFRSVDGVTQDRFTLSDADPRPDAVIQRGPSGPVRGDDVYNTTGTGQTAGGTAPASTPQRYRITVQNDAPFAEVLRVRGTPPDPAFSVRYRVAGVDVTAAVTAGTYLTPALEPGASLTLKAVVVPGAGARVGSGLRGTLTVRSTTHPTSRDVVTFLTIRT